MSKSGIPVVSQIGSAASSVGNAVGSVIDPSAPTPIPAPTLSAGNAEASAETDEEENAGRGMAADMLTGPGGLTSSAPVARNVLLGS